MNIIAFTGKAGCGKDTAVRAIKSKYHNAIHYSFASPLRQGLAAMLGGDIEIKSHNQDLKNVPDELYGVSPRKMLQTLGTEWGRNMINDSIWIIRAKQIWKESGTEAIILISDCRFDNEAQAVLDMGGKVIEINRPHNPHTEGINQGGVANHVSEAGVDPKLVSYTITNAYDSISSFERRIMTDEFINSHLKGK